MLLLFIAYSNLSLSNSHLENGQLRKTHPNPLTHQQQQQQHDQEEEEVGKLAVRLTKAVLLLMRLDYPPRTRMHRFCSIVCYGSWRAIPSLSAWSKPKMERLKDLMVWSPFASSSLRTQMEALLLLSSRFTTVRFWWRAGK